jgi:hypothetical protein
MLAWEALSREFVDRATLAAPGADRRQWIERAENTIARGLTYFERLPLRSTHYRPAERLSASTMYRFRGELALLAGAPARVVLEPLRKGYLLAKTGRGALLLAQATMQMAGEDAPDRREAWVRMSFAYFSYYAETARPDASQRPTALDMLTLNYSRFAYLANSVRALEDTLR